MGLYAQIQSLPRHLGQHSGGMVVCQGALDSIVPIEPATMPGRTVIQWDKDDIADMGIVKVDLLGLGMLAVIKDTIELVRQHHGRGLILPTYLQTIRTFIGPCNRATLLAGFKLNRELRCHVRPEPVRLTFMTSSFR